MQNDVIVEQTGNTTTFRYWSKWLMLALIIWTGVLVFCFDKPVALLQSNYFFIPLGFLGSLLGNISAIGGGIVFIPAMMFVFHLPPVVALKVALASQCFGMSSGAVGWIQKKAVPFSLLKKTVPGLLCGSVIGSLLIHPSALLIKAFFGPVSILLGAITLFNLYRSKDVLHPAPSPEALGLPLFFVSLLGGVITGWIAIGEGELVAALLMLRYGFPPAICIGLGVTLLAINSLFLTAIHQLFLGGIPWHIAIFTGLGCIFGARLAPFLAAKASSRFLKICFAIIAIGDGALFIFQYFSAKI